MKKPALSAGEWKPLRVQREIPAVNAEALPTDGGDSSGLRPSE